MHSVNPAADTFPAPTRRPFLPAVVGPRAARAIFRAAGAQLDRYAQGLSASPVAENREYGREMQLALASMRESVRLWEERTQGGPGSANGTSELPPGVEGAQSGHPPGTPPLAVSQVAERLDVSASYVMRLCRDGRLSATKPGREWLIGATSVKDFEAARRI